MHRDKKLGLALGVLLVGIVGAFFFRNETARDDAPRLKNPESLDSVIAEKSLTPYLGGPETGRDAKPVQIPEPAPRKPRRWDPPSFLTDVPDAVMGDPVATLPGPPDPIAPAPQIDETAAPIRLPEPRRTRSISNPRVVAPSTSRDLVPDPSPMFSERETPTRTHRVVSGDTLSGLAERYLGSHRRFDEIFAANRDQLRNPDDLKLGMILEIPPREACTARKSVRTDRAGAETPPPFDQTHDADSSTRSQSGSAMLPTIEFEESGMNDVLPPIPGGGEADRRPEDERRFVPYERSPLSRGGREELRSSQHEIRGRRVSGGIIDNPHTTVR